MKEEILLLILLGLILFFVINSGKSRGPASTSATAPAGPVYDGTAVPLEVIQAVIEKFQTTQEDMVPLETLFFTSTGNGTYKARLMFMNTRHFFGQQFDINAAIDDSGAVTITESETTSDPVSYTSAYQPDTYQSFDVVDASLKSQLKTALTASRSNTFPIQLASSFSSSFQNSLSPQDVMTRASTDMEKMNF
jgi:hypothetical protein